MGNTCSPNLPNRQFLRFPASTQSSLSDLLAVVDGQVMTKSKSLSPVGELKMSFDEWYQAWQRLLKIINQHHPNEFDLWRTHFTSIMLKETCAEDWPLWLAYDTEVRRRSITTALNPSQFQKRLFDNLYIHYSSTKILMQVQATTNSGPSSHSPSSSRHQPYQHAPNNGYTSRFHSDSFCAHSSNSLKVASR